METLCESCIAWVKCKNKDNSEYGFCLLRDLFTYTAETQCNDYIKGNPLTEEEYEYSMTRSN